MTPLPSTLPLVTVSVVSHGQIDLILPLLSQLDQFCHDCIAEVILTHNISECHDENDLTLQFPVRSILNPAPYGFGANHNAAFKYCKTPWFLVLNPDVRLHDDILSLLITKAQPESVLLAPRVQEPNKGVAEPHRELATPWELIARRRASYRPPKNPEWLPGLFMLIRSSAYASVGGFDERFFMYGEDVDLCARLVLVGGKIQIDENSTICHEARRNSHENRQHLKWHLASLLRLWISPTFWRYFLQLRFRPSN